MALRLLFSGPLPASKPRLRPRPRSSPLSLPASTISLTPPLLARRPYRLASTLAPADPQPPFEPSAIAGSEEGIWTQIREIALFAGPATGLWVCGPLMSLIDTMVIGQSSSLELAALGPATVVCDYLSYLFMFLSIATSNMIATSLAKKDNDLAQHQISMLLFVAFACGLVMFLFTKLLGPQILTVRSEEEVKKLRCDRSEAEVKKRRCDHAEVVALLDRTADFPGSAMESWNRNIEDQIGSSAFSGSENLHIVPAANTYVQIRGFAWPAVLVGMVAQSASLGMKDSWGPLKALAVASAINGFGDLLLCSVFSYGIAGAAWATMLSQVCAAFMMMESLNKTGFKAFVMSVPSATEICQIFEIAAPVFITMTSKVAFYSLLAYCATSMGTMTIAAHQVMINVYCMCTVWGEPLSQTAQSFMPELIHGVNRSLRKARMLLKSLVIIGGMSGSTLGVIGTSVPWLFPYLFTNDCMVTGEMHKVLIPYFIALVVTPSTHSLEGTLLASRDLKFLSLSMTGCFCSSGLLLLLASSRGFGLSGCWWVLAGFQWARFTLALQRLISPQGVLYNEDLHSQDYVKVKAT